MKSIIYILVLLFGLQVQARGDINLNRSQINRQLKRFTILGNYSYLDLWIPNKVGATIALNTSAARSWELEYMRGDIGFGWLVEDLGHFSDQRLSLTHRQYLMSSSFNVMYSLFYSSTKIDIGSEFLTGITPKDNYDVIGIDNVGLSVGLGNRWVQPGGFVFGIDWFIINVPIKNISTSEEFITSTLDDDDKELAEDLIAVFKHIPGFVFLKIQLGFSF